MILFEISNRWQLMIALVMNLIPQLDTFLADPE